jgi:hypothetical protein
MGAICPKYKPLTIYGAEATDSPLALPHKDQEGKTAVTTTSGWDGSSQDGGPNHYVEIPVEDATYVSIFLRWYDGTISVNGTGVVQVTNFDHAHAKVYDETADWVTDSSIAFTGPAGSAAASEMITISAVSVRRLRLKLPITANGDLSVHYWAKE